MVKRWSLLVEEVLQLHCTLCSQGTCALQSYMFLLHYTLFACSQACVIQLMLVDAALPCMLCMLACYQERSC